MKKKNAPIKVVAISTIAVLALGGISAVSVFSLAKNPDGAAASGIQNAGLDAASGKVAVREDVAEAPVVLEVTDAADQAAYSYESAPVYDAAAAYEVPAELVVVSSLVEAKASPEDVPVIAAVQHVETAQETALAAVDEEKKEEAPVSEPVAELAVVDSAPVFAEPVAEPEAVEPVYEEPAAEIPVFEVQEPVAQVAAADEPVYEVPEEEEPVYEVPAYEEPDAIDYSAYLAAIPEYDVDYGYTEAAAQPVETAEDVSGSPASTTATGLRQQLVDFANSRVGVTPYVWAGRDLDTGTDCSGFVNLVYDNFGLYASPGSDDYQSLGENDYWGENISYSELQPGDVVVYRNGGHVGIYAGQDENGTDIIIHDSNEIDGVKVSDMNYSTPTAFVRVTGMDAAAPAEESYSDEEDYEDDWYYAYDDGSDYDYDDEYDDYDYDYDDYDEDEDYGYWN